MEKDKEVAVTLASLADAPVSNNAGAGECSAAEKCHEGRLSDDGVWLSDCDEEADETFYLDREGKRRREEFYNAGYRDGLTAGKNVAVQEGFNQGFKDSVMIGNKWGIVRGVTSKSLNDSPSKRFKARDVKSVEKSKVTAKRRKMGEEHFKSRKIGGCLPALLVAFVQKVHFGEHAGVELPFISNWNSDTLNARIKAQSEDRAQFGAGIVKQDIVVSSNVFVEKKLAEVVEHTNDVRISSENDSGLYLQYKIPNDLPTDKEIHSMNISDIEKKLMILHRNIKITSSINLDLIKEIKEDGEKLSQQSSQPKSDFNVNDELFEMLGSFKENFIKQKEIVDKKKGFPVMFDKKKESDIYYIEGPPIFSKNKEIRNDEAILGIYNNNEDNMIFEKSNDEKISNEEVISDVANKRNDDVDPNDGISIVSTCITKDTSNITYFNLALNPTPHSENDEEVP